VTSYKKSPLGARASRDGSRLPRQILSWPLASALIRACIAASGGRLWGDSPLTIDLGRE